MAGNEDDFLDGMICGRNNNQTIVYHITRVKAGKVNSLGEHSEIHDLQRSACPKKNEEPAKC